MEAAGKEKRFVALTSVLAAVALTGMKLGVGLWTNSLGILSEAAHSSLDLVAAIVTLWAVSMSDRPADSEHTYGHGKFENLSALLETLLLLGTCVWIVREGVDRLFFHEPVVEVRVWSFVVVLTSIVVDFSRSRALKRVADKYGSQALEADALHFSTDIWSSCVVLLGLFGVLAAQRFGMPWLMKMDALAALCVAAIVIHVCWRLGKKSVSDLLDAVPPETPRSVSAAAAGVPGVEEVRKVRVRRSGPEFFADVTIAVAQGETVEETHAIADRAEDAVRAALPHADVVVHVEPGGGPQDLPALARAAAARQRLGVHNLRIYDEGGKRSLEAHLDVPEGLRLEEAHNRASAFEDDIRRASPGLAEVVTHLEPSGETASTLRSEPTDGERVAAAVEEFLAARGCPGAARDVKTRLAEGELSVSLRFSLDASIDITSAHKLTEEFERWLRSRVPRLGRVVIHVEPRP
ncbi:MAG: cation diffusion facilitator family transporter [Elusimicrobiota bacterium]